MILVDANLLLYARLSSYDQHAAAHRWLDEKLNGRAGVGLPWESLLAFLRLATSPRLFPRPLPMDEAWSQVRAWLALPTTWIPTAGEGHEGTLDRLVRGRGLTPKLVMDAHLAALAIDHGLLLCSADRDFMRFEELRFVDPFA
ncbi:MAG: VapC toxin family PIN domain ribonuclease [Gemmatimonadetes bacterium]|nr:VapC toxin family PIN domain ribonuclease [Gemmatimonadota bacterium]